MKNLKIEIEDDEEQGRAEDTSLAVKWGKNFYLWKLVMKTFLPMRKFLSCCSSDNKCLFLWNTDNLQKSFCQFNPNKTISSTVCSRCRDFFLVWAKETNKFICKFYSKSFKQERVEKAVSVLISSSLWYSSILQSHSWHSPRTS